ncbi:unnamed protein product [Phaeothamnion confervicola]
MAAAKLATRYWRRFGRDVFLDLVVFRRHGHNEVDEPAFTQPAMYRRIRGEDGSAGGGGGGGGGGGSYPQAYAARLRAEGLLANSKVEQWVRRFEAHLEAELAASAALDLAAEPPDALRGKWAGLVHPTAADCHARIATGAAEAALVAAALASVETPPGLEVHPRLRRGHVEARRRQVTGADSGGGGSGPGDGSDAARTGGCSGGGGGGTSGCDVDWATAEAMAFGTLLAEGDGVRICGQDVGRGTFSQRHARLICQQTGASFVPLAEWDGATGHFEVVNSPLSELAVLAFEVGHSWEDPQTLCIWEAQFGDFANCAQMIIDQYISGSESKWLRQTGLTLLLPHGMDGAGPEHSSGRMERFLQLLDDPGIAPPGVAPVIESGGDGGGLGEPVTADATTGIGGGNCGGSGGRGGGQVLPGAAVNMFVCQPSTPANYFHLLRRQQRRNFRKPLVVMAPKVLLRLPEAVSPMTDMTEGTAFEPVLADAGRVPREDPEKIRRVLLCSGKIYYDLAKRRAAFTSAGNSTDAAAAAAGSSSVAAAGSGGDGWRADSAAVAAAAATAVLRLEQLAPFPARELAAELARFPSATEFVWVQEEALNAGAAAFVHPQIQRILGPGRQMGYVGRPVLPAPAVGLGKRHAAQAAAILRECFP